MDKNGRMVGREPLPDMWRILVRGNLFKKKDRLMEESRKYLCADAIGVKVIASLILGAWFLFLRILAFGYPHMSEKMLANPSLTAAGVIMYFPLYVIGVLMLLLAWALIRKIIIMHKIKQLDRMIDECKPCWKS